MNWIAVSRWSSYWYTKCAQYAAANAVPEIHRRAGVPNVKKLGWGKENDYLNWILAWARDSGTHLTAAAAAQFRLLTITGGVIPTAIQSATETIVAAVAIAGTIAATTGAAAAATAQAVAAIGAIALSSCQALLQLDLIATHQTRILKVRHGEHVGAGVVGVVATQFGLAGLGTSGHQVMCARWDTCKPNQKTCK